MIKTTKQVVSGLNVIELSMRPRYQAELAVRRRRRLLPTGPSAISDRSILWRASALGDRREGECQETMAYSVLCLCGLWMIGLCLL